MSNTEKNEPPQSPRRENRIAAMQFIYMMEVNRTDDLNNAIRIFFEGREHPRDYYAFAQELVIGVYDHIERIDKTIQQCAENWSFHRIAKVDLAIMRLAIYELLFRHDIPPIVSINEAIDLGKHFSDIDSKRFINGILDKVKERLGRPLRTPSQQ